MSGGDEEGAFGNKIRIRQGRVTKKIPAANPCSSPPGSRHDLTTVGAKGASKPAWLVLNLATARFADGCETVQLTNRIENDF